MKFANSVNGLAAKFVRLDFNEGLAEQELRGHLYANEKSSYKLSFITA